MAEGFTDLDAEMGGVVNGGDIGDYGTNWTSDIFNIVPIVIGVIFIGDFVKRWMRVRIG